MSTMDLSKPFRRLVTIADPDMKLDEATGRATFIYNTEDVGRDGHIVRNRGIHLDNYRTNPVILWAHDDEAPPVGRAIEINAGDPASRVTVEFTPRDLYPFGDMVGRMITARFLNCVSESWNPLKAKIRSGGEGYDFLEVDLLEVSIVPVPALPQAVATARAAGIDTTPMLEWSQQHLDIGSAGAIPRAELLMLRRAACGRSVAYSFPATSVGQRSLIAEELIRKGQRQDLASLLQARTVGEVSVAARRSLQAVQQHHGRCETSHDELARRHQRMRDNVGALSGLHRALKRALSEAGVATEYPVKTALANLERCASSIEVDHDGACGAVDDAASALGLRASRCRQCHRWPGKPGRSMTVTMCSAKAPAGGAPGKHPQLSTSLQRAWAEVRGMACRVPSRCPRPTWRVTMAEVDIQTATISAGQSLSSEADIGNKSLVGLVLPSGWTASAGGLSLCS